MKLTERKLKLVIRLLVTDIVLFPTGGIHDCEWNWAEKFEGIITGHTACGSNCELLSHPWPGHLSEQPVELEVVFECN